MKNFIQRNRQSLRLRYYDYSSEGYYFVTICTKDRINYFGKIKKKKMILSKEGFVLKKIWRELFKKFSNISLDSFIIMPNHFHAISIIKRKTNQALIMQNCRNLNCGALINQSPTVQINQAPTKQISKNPMLLPVITLGYIIRYFKAKSTFIIRKIDKESYFSWQSLFYEHIIRNKMELFYIRL